MRLDSQTTQSPRLAPGRRAYRQSHDLALESLEILRRPHALRGRLAAVQSRRALRHRRRQRLRQVDPAEDPDRRRESPATASSRSRSAPSLGVLEQDHFQYEDERILDVVMMGNEAALGGDGREGEDPRRGRGPLRRRPLRRARGRHPPGATATPSRPARARSSRGSASRRRSTSSRSRRSRAASSCACCSRRCWPPSPTCCCSTSRPTTSTSSRSAGSRSSSQGYKGVALVISHDHRFLDNVATTIVDVDYDTITLYPGNYAHFVRAKQRRARARGGRDREARGGDRRPQGVRRALPRQGDQGAPGPEQAQGDRADRDRGAARELAALSALPLRAAAPERQAGARARGHHEGATATSACSTASSR